MAFSDVFTGKLDRTAGENVGTHAIQQGTLALSSNYVLAYVGANLSINPLAVTGSVAVASKVYDGTTAATITGRSLTGVINGDDVTLSGGTATFADKNVGNGKTVTVTGLTLSGSKAANYTVNTIAITTADITSWPVTVTADAKSKAYGGADPSLSYQVTSGSLAPGDSFAGTLARVAGENVGSYAIQQGSLSLNGNYTLTFIGANLTITAKNASVTPNPATKVYGSPDPTLTGTLSGFLVADGCPLITAGWPGRPLAITLSAPRSARQTDWPTTT